MKIAFDVMGFENDLNEAIKAAKFFCCHHHDAKIIFVGDKKKILQNLNSHDDFEIIHTSDFIKMTDKPIEALRKNNTSMYIAINLVKQKHADAILSAGSTSCFVPLVKTILGLIDNIKMFGFMSFVPTIDKKGFNILDVGSNIYTSGIDLYNFALMANTYAQLIRKIKNPRIGILNIGTEVHKGYQYHFEANKLLSNNKKLNYIGFIEPKELFDGCVDLCICDGYTGNICIKSFEGAFKTIGKILKDNYIKPWNWLGAVCSLPIIKTLTTTFDYRNNAGAIVLGANGIAIKVHGSADAKQFIAGLNMAYNCQKNNLLQTIKKINYE